MAQPAPTNDTEPILPPVEEAGLLALVRDVLDKPLAATLLGAGGEAVELPRSVHEALVRVVRELTRGNAVTPAWSPPPFSTPACCTRPTSETRS